MTATHILVFLSHGLALPVDLCEIVWNSFDKSYRQTHISRLLKKQYIDFAINDAHMELVDVESEIGGREENDIVLYSMPGATCSTTLYEVRFEYEDSTNRYTKDYWTREVISGVQTITKLRTMHASLWHTTLKGHIVGRTFIRRVMKYLGERFAWTSDIEREMNNAMQTEVKPRDNSTILFKIRVIAHFEVNNIVVCLCASDGETNCKVNNNTVSMDECVTSLAERLHLVLSAKTLASIPSVFKHLRPNIARKLEVTGKPDYKLRDKSPKRASQK